MLDGLLSIVLKQNKPRERRDQTKNTTYSKWSSGSIIAHFGASGCTRKLYDLARAADGGADLLAL